MTEFVLVHSPVVGPGTWSGVAGALVSRGHRAVVPSLQAATREGRPAWEAQTAAVVAACDEHDVKSPVAVGHSAAGLLLPAIGRRLDRAAGYVFVDAVLPADGASAITSFHPALRARLESLTRDGVLPPWNEWWGDNAMERALPDPVVREKFVAELEPIPARIFDEPLPSIPEWPDAPCGYLRLSDAFESEEAAAAGRGWAVARVDGTHLEMLRSPEVVTAALLRVVDRMGSGAR